MQNWQNNRDAKPAESTAAKKEKNANKDIKKESKDNA